MKKKVLVAMSGGVDSSACALLLLNAGYDLTGVTMLLFKDKDLGLPTNDEKQCKDIEDARRVADKLGITHKVVDLCACFKKSVIDHFVKEYEVGRTPNPCIDCNKHIKFGQLLKIAEEEGCDYLATGHYAKIYFDETKNRWLLARGNDRSKDQSYMLFNLKQEQLAKVLLPLSNISKQEIREMSEKAELPIAQKPDSQDICFVPNGDYAQIIKNISKKKMPPGKFVHLNGQVLGKHQGIINYTIGQRKGLGIAYEHPLYVIDKDISTNTVTLGANDALFSKALLAEHCNFISIDFLDTPMQVTVKTRYRQVDVPATIEPCGNMTKVIFGEPQRAITPGQAVVFYDGELVVGGGIIKQALSE